MYSKGTGGNFEHLFICDWASALFVNFEVDQNILRREVPYELDTFDGKAYVSLVAFTIRRLRPRFGGRVGEWLFSPIGTHGFLNVRTYVRHRGVVGIYFMMEWLDNRLSVLMGPPTFGLPYRYGKLDYRHDEKNGILSDSVQAGNERFVSRATFDPNRKFTACARGSVDNFIMERYVAFTARGARRLLFKVGHDAWMQTPVNVAIQDAGLLVRHCTWYPSAKLSGANYSPGVCDVAVGFPQRVGAGIHTPAVVRPSMAGSSR